MDYQTEIERIITAMRSDPNLEVKWRNKAIARLEEAQVFSMVVKDDAPAPAPGITFDGQNLTPPAITLDDIPEELRSVAKLPAPQPVQVNPKSHGPSI